MHSGDLSEIGQASLTQQEKASLLQVMERAKEFDRQQQVNSVQAATEGQLYKWTNPLKGWQPRWFSVHHQQGVLHYYTSEDKKKQAPRGSLHLWGAVVAPSEEDSQSFTVNGANGEVYKLRGQDAKERQFWVSRLRKEVECCTNQSFGGRESVDNAISGDSNHTSPQQLSSKAASRRIPALSFSRKHSSRQHKTLQPVRQDDSLSAEHFPGGDAMLEVLTRLQTLQDSFYVQLQTNSTQAGLSPNCKEVLLARATSQAAVTSIRDCLALLKLQLQDNEFLYDASPQHNISNDRSLHFGPSDGGSPGASGTGGEKNEEEKLQVD